MSQIVEVEDIILYPSHAKKHPGVALGLDQPLPLIEEELVSQGRAKDAAARNANLQPLDVTGVGAALPFVCASMDELDNYKSDDNDNIIAVADIPQQPPHAPFVLNNTNDDNNVGSDDDSNNTESDEKESNNDNNAESNDNKLSDLAAATDFDGNEPDKNQRSTLITVC